MGSWLFREARKWVEAGIITNEQFDLIISRYPQRSGFANLMPFFASLLVGLGLISWIASNWDDIDRWVRLGIVLFFVIAFYGLGDFFKRRGNEPTAIGMIGLGVISFGAGLILTAQMFQLGSQSELPFVLWSLAALGMAWWNRSTVLYILGWAISFSGLTLGSGNLLWEYVVIFIYIFGYFAYPRLNGKPWLMWFWSVGSIAYALKFISIYHADSYWLTIWWLVLYGLNTWEKTEEYRVSHRTIGLYGMFINGLFFAISAESTSFWGEFGTAQYTYLVIGTLLLALSAWQLIRRGEKIALTDGLVLIPWFILNPTITPQSNDATYQKWSDVRYLSLLPLIPYAIHALLSLWRGSVEKRQALPVLGTIQFLVVTLSVFAIVDWNLNVKFLIFVISGLIMFVSHAWIRRRAADEKVNEVKS